MEELEDSYACGLDLGTTFSCIGVYKNGGVIIIPNKNGDKITPSIVTILNEDTILKGEETLNYLVKEYDSSIYAVKRFIGRDLHNSKVREEIKKENFPFNIKENSKTKHLVIEIEKNGKMMEFNIEEISSFIIRKMVDNAEEYLKRKINKLVITVPANFDDSQRKATKQAAELAGLEVLRIINEPTAAALAYGLQEKNIEDNGNILVFDLGGGTFDVTILKIDTNKEEEIKEDKNKKEENKEDNEKYFEILSTCGDKFLGGEDFDNKLVDYFLKDFCNKNKIPEETIKKDKKAIKRLKISCENIKKVLSIKTETELCISNFYNNKDINKKISRNNFEILCEELFKKLINPLKEALTLAKLTKDKIKQIVLVGGSTRIPKIKDILNEFFKNPEIKINDTINPDETVAYGATLMAAKILYKKSAFTSEFNLMDITPFSLGTDIKNKSLDKEIQKEGKEMSVIIKRGSKIPIHNIKTYFTTINNQKSVSINVYEGEKKYVKYNHLLKEANLAGLTEKPAGKVKILVKFQIDENGILIVTGKEEDTDNNIEIKIRNDGIILTEEEIEKIKEKNKKYMDKCKIKMNIDYKNIKETLKQYKDKLIKTKDEEDKFDIIMGCINFLEAFINKFGEDFDNETIIEKFYIYIKELFIYYTKAFKLREYLDKGEKNRIKEAIKNYLNIFIKLSSGYLDDLLDILKDLPNRVFKEIILFIMKKFKDFGEDCLKKMQKFCRYNSLKYFEKTKNIFSKYIGDITDLLFDNKMKEECEILINTCSDYIDDINSYIILLCEDAIKFDKLISSGTGLTTKKKVLIDEDETYHIILETYEKMLPQYEGKGDKKEALILVNIIKINYRLLGNLNFNMYYKMAQRVEFITKDMDPKPEWYKDFCKIYTDLKDDYNPDMKTEEIKEKIQKKFKPKFDEIDEMFINKNSNLDFIRLILEKIPYNGYDQDKNNRKEFFEKETPELFRFLKNKYSPDKYTFDPQDEESQLRYCLIGYIDGFFNRLYTIIN